MKARLALPFCYALVAAGCLVDMDDVAPVDSALQSVTGTGAPVVFTHGDGTTSSVHAASGTALFTVGTATGQTLEDALLQWLRTGVYYGLTTASDIQLQEVDRAQIGALEVVRFGQSYRGIPLVGPAGGVVVTLHGGDAVSVSGRPIDATPDYAGLKRRMSTSGAEAALIAAYQVSHPGGAPAVSGLTLVAVSGQATLGWKADVKAPGDEAVEIIVDAVAGSVLNQSGLDYYDLDQPRPVHLNVEQVGADPVWGPEGMAWNMPGALVGYCPDPNDDEDCFVRMGTMRLSVYDYQQDNTAVPVLQTMPITHLFNPGEPWSKFLYDRPSHGFNAQNMYHKAVLATGTLDPLVSALHWDHHPATPWTSTEPASVQLMVNVDGQTAAGPYCGLSPAALGALGVYRGYMLGPAEAAAVDPPYPGAAVPTISLCSNDESVLFHELGHYYDTHLAAGTMGTGIEKNDTCTPDTTDEAPPLAETVADMMAAALYARLYPSVAYNMSTTSMPCSLGAMGLPGGVHGDGCNGPRHFDVDRPSTVQFGACKKDAGYDQIGVQQAWWKFLKGKTCSSVAPYTCTTVTQSPDTGLRALLFALKQSNAQSYKELVHNMATWIELSGTTSEHTRFAAAFALHGLID